MKIRVISEFYDKFHTSTLYKVGTVLDFDDEERCKDIIAKKLGEPYSEPEKKNAEPKPEPKPEEKTDAPAAEQKPEKKKLGRPKTIAEGKTE